MRRVLAGAAVLALTAAGCGGAVGTHSAALTGSWVGSYVLGGPGRLSLSVDGTSALVALGVGHADLQAVEVTSTDGHVRLRLPGRPTSLAFDGEVANGRFTGSVSQGAAHGTFSLRHGRAPDLLARGLFETSSGLRAVVDDLYGPARLVDLDSGAVNALYPAGAGFVIGSGFATRFPSVGTARFGNDEAEINGKTARRVRIRQLEVRFRSGAEVLSGTLSLPSGPGRHAGVAFVHGSGPTGRSYLPELQSLLVHHGIAVLTYDKRGIGQSGGFYPGDSPTSGAIDTLARDAEAAVRFLAVQPEIDPARTGLAGHSQAGWIAPLAASREPAVRFLVLFSGPAVKADENDLYQTLAGEGEHPATLSDAAIDAEVLRARLGGVDPIPWIRKLRIPVLWVYGERDRHVPPRLSERRLRPIARESARDFTVVSFPNANHALVETQSGLTSEMLRSATFAPGLFSRVGQWLDAHRLSGR